ncbi:hypothetical protein TIFTF001_019703 [Ficus carica]|uniref:Uncharacterized protein n=1 Tax=Ficus carica TaxID=3494 RepID=A0AA88A9C7_FICCA|nr:hypothetical protein TIFTF001_019703 [Ficus carica]
MWSGPRRGARQQAAPPACRSEVADRELVEISAAKKKPIFDYVRTAALAVVVAVGRRSERKAGAVGMVWEGLLMFGAGTAARRSEVGKMKLEEDFR